MDIKVDPKSIRPGVILDIPVFMVENRDADEASWWENGQILSLSMRYLTGPAELISFTPREEFQTDSSFWNIFNNGLNGSMSLTTEDQQNFEPGSGGVPTEVDNSGITGRSEVQIGVLRVKVGPEIKRMDDKGNEVTEIFQMHFGFRPPNSDLPWVFKRPNGAHNGAVMVENLIVILASDRDNAPDPSPTPTSTPGSTPSPTPTPDNGSTPSPTPESTQDVELSATETLGTFLDEALGILAQLKRKIGGANKEVQLSLRETLRERADLLRNYTNQNSADINTTKNRFNVKRASKKARRRLKRAARKSRKGFQRRKKQARKAVLRLQRNLDL